MPTPDHEAYRARTLAWFREHSHAPDVPAQLERHGQAAAVLLELDLHPPPPPLPPPPPRAPRPGRARPVGARPRPRPPPPRRLLRAEPPRRRSLGPHPHAALPAAHAAGRPAVHQQVDPRPCRQPRLARPRRPPGRRMAGRGDALRLPAPPARRLHPRGLRAPGAAERGRAAPLSLASPASAHGETARPAEERGAPGPG